MLEIKKKERKYAMTAKEYLSQISRLDRMIKNKLTELARLKELSYGLSAIPNEERVQTTPNHDKIGTAVAKIIDMEKEIDIIVDTFIDLKKEVYQKIHMLKSPRHKYILIQKYIKYKSIYDIAEELKMTDRGCKKAHKRALEELEKINRNTIYCIMLDRTLLDIV